MKRAAFFFLLISTHFFCQNIHGIQLFNPQTNDETPVIGFNESLILRFDDFDNTSRLYRYTIRHCDRNWQPDGLFFTEIASGSMSGLIDNYSYSFNTLQKYTHYELKFPNEKMQPKISGNFELIVYENSPERPLFRRRFSISEGLASASLRVSRTADARQPAANQRVEVQATSEGYDINSVANSLTMSVVQNSNPWMRIDNIRPTSVLANHITFQHPGIIFPGNNEFYYFDNKNITAAFDMVSATESIEDQYYTYLFPVWAFPQNYQYMPDVNGAYYFRRNDLGTERDPHREGDYSWVYFALDSEPVDKEIFVLGGFNEFQPSQKNQMFYDENAKKYIAKIYLKQGFYNYILATRSGGGTPNFGEINGNFWQTENLYQAYLYYRPFGRNYDGLLGYGEFRTPVR